MRFFRSTLRPMMTLFLAGIFLLGLMTHLGHRHESSGHTGLQASCQICQYSPSQNPVDLSQKTVVGFNSPTQSVLVPIPSTTLLIFPIQAHGIRGPPTVA